MRTRTPMLALCVLTLGCVATHERPQNKGEKTLASKNVTAMVEKEGAIDTREHKGIRCDRIKLTGSHMVTRFCYSTAEEKETARKSQDVYYRRFVPAKCLSRDGCSG